MDFKFCKIKLDDSGIAQVQAPVVMNASRKDHDDVCYLYRLRKALVLLVGEEGLKGFTLNQLIDLHTAIVTVMLNNGISHWYSTYDSDLDDTLPENLKLKSDGYEPPDDSELFNLEEDERNYLKLLEENNVRFLWTAPTKRKDVPSSHFLDPKGKKYPYKDSNGKVSCGGLKAAIQAAGGARSGVKNPTIQAKAKSLYSKNCAKKKAEDFMIVGRMI